MKEKWKSPKSVGMPWFEVSNLGRCRTKSHIEQFLRHGKIAKRLRPGNNGKNFTLDSRGRKQVYVHTSNGTAHRKLILLHRLVAECFVKNDNPSVKTMVFFKDNNYKNCRCDNLYWDGVKEKGFRMRCKKNAVGLFMTADADERPFMVFESCSALAAFLGVTKQAASYAYRHGGPCIGHFVRSVNPTGSTAISKREAVCFDHKFPNDLYAESPIDISRRAIFK